MKYRTKILYAIFIFTIATINLYSQEDSLNIIVVNEIDTLNQNQWVVNHEFKNIVDSVFFDPKLKRGIIKSYSRSGIIQSEKIFCHEQLEKPNIQIYESLKVIGSEKPIANNSYFGYKIYFPDVYLIQRKIFYSSGKIEKILNYDYLLTDEIIVSFDLIDYNEKRDTMKTWKSTLNGKSFFYLQNGEIDKVKSYKSGKEIE